MAVTIDELQLEIKNNSTAATQGIDAFTASLERLRAAVKGGSGLTTVTKQLQAFSQTINGLNLSADASNKIKALVDTLKPLEEIQKSNLGSALNHLKKIPEITKALSSKELAKFGVQIRLVTKYVQPLATEMEKVSQGFSKLPVHLQRAIRENEKFNNSAKKSNTVFKMLNSSVAGFIAKASLLYMGMKRIGNTIANWIMESNEYVENLNLFTASMGEYAESAQKYAEQVGDILGFDPSDWMRNQGIFMTLATGFGVAADKAALMSKNLTQLGYDLSSFFNIPVSEAMQKLQSGISGELEPLRRLGYDLSQAKLEAIALSQGIDKLVADMTQAEKSQLRYYAILTQVTTAQGDMARTLEAPANQLRILQAQVTQAARALGNIFIPALNAVLPYAIAFMKVIRGVANEVANIFGFTLPEIDYSNLNAIGGEAGEVAGAFDDADDKAKEFKKTLLGIDQINILGAQKAIPTMADGGNVNLGINLPQYDFLGGLLGGRVNQIAQELEEPFKNVLKTVGLIAVGMLGWKISTNVMSAIDWFKNNAKMGKIALGITLSLIGFSLAADGFIEIGKGDAKTWDYIKAALGSAIGIGGSLITLGTGPLGWAVGIVAALGVSIYGITVGTNKRIKQIADDAFAASGLGGLNPDTILSELQSSFDGYFGTQNRLIVNLGVSLDTSRNAISELQTDLRGLNDIIFGDSAPTQTEVEMLKDTWGKLGDTFKDVFGTSENTIMASFTAKFSEMAAQAGKDAMTMKAQFLVLSGEMGTAMATLTAEAESLGVKIALGNASDGERARYLNLSQALLDTMPKKADIEKQLGDIGKIDFGEKDAEQKARNFIKELGTTAQTLVGENKKAYETAISATEDYVKAAAARLKIGDITQEQYTSQVQYWDDYRTLLGTTYASQEQQIKDAVGGIFGKIENQLVTAQNTAWSNALNSAEYGIISDFFGGKGGWWLDDAFKTRSSDLAEKAEATFDKNIGTPIRDAFKDTMSGISNTGISAAQLEANKLYKGVTDAFGGLSIEASYSSSSGSVSGGYTAGKYSNVHKVQAYATGGFPVPGDLFYANEVAPEFVGSFGNKPAVANNGQIVEGIKRGVKEALQESSSNGGGGIIEMTFIMNDEEMARGTLKGINKLNKSSGRVLIPVDVM